MTSHYLILKQDYGAIQSLFTGFKRAGKVTLMIFFYFERKSIPNLSIILLLLPS